MTVAPYIPDRFDTAVDPYVRYRLRYAPALIGWLVAEVGLDGNSTVLDLGCGPGFLGNELAPHAGRVVGVDPSAAMLAAARAEAPANATYLEGSSYDLSMVAPPVHLVTMGRSFHWMDRAAVLRRLDGLVAPGGAVAVIADQPIEGPSTAWWRAAQEVARAFEVRDDCTRLRQSDAWEVHETVLLGSPFADLRRIGVYARHAWRFEDVIGNILSRSGTTATLLADRRAALEAALRDALAPFGPAPWTTVNAHTAIVARRP